MANAVVAQKLRDLQKAILRREGLGKEIEFLELDYELIIRGEVVRFLTLCPLRN